ncbi:hypothetical protein DFQ04_0283 [Algoriphagus boseongensis]|uniref:Lipocalin-like protein n=1 Tax=Algoriphagus boseongensis TaxID=1442587 RepID=A0A4R6T761_9BACT|nr:hypothetical protein [Algoriphagus boseongensis]TDQ18481.1 hypothetical protein DFQ04_0283 [Algoriphagus boseongensis]
MKSLFKTCLGLALTFLLVFAIGCNNESDPNSNQIDEIQNEVSSGQWVITRFEDSGKNETSNFSGFFFVFSPSGTLTATKSPTGYTGNWSITDSNSNDDSPDDLEFNIFFSLTNDFEDLNDDWDIVSHSSSKIELIDVSGGGGGTDYLTFEKR